MTHRPDSEPRDEHLQRLATLGTLAASSAHEVNNIVTQLLATLRHAVEATEHLDDSDAAAWRSKLESALDTGQLCCERLRELARGMTHCAQAPSSELAIVDIIEVLDQAVEIVNPELHTIALVQRDYESAIPPVRANAGKLCQVFVNLLVNAAHAVRDHRDRANHCVSIEARLADDWVCVDVRDTGTGMTEEITARVFDPFFTTKPSDVGTGLGLAVSRGIVDELGGRILVSTAPGKGTTFTVLLPCA